MTEPKTETVPRHKRVLAKPMVVAGELMQPGETVSLTDQQIERLAAEGYFEPEIGKKRGSSK